MKLDQEHQRLFEGVLQDIESICKSDRDLAERLSKDMGVPIPALTLAKLKRGDSVGEDRWRAVVDGLKALVTAEDSALSLVLDPSRKVLLANRLDRIVQFGQDPRMGTVHRVASDELDIAGRKYAALREDPESQVPWGGKAVIYRLDSPSGGSELEDKLDKVISSMIAMSSGNFPLSIKERARVSADATGYRKMMDWNISTLMPAFLLFPFFLTQNRRQNWGVIPYGRSRSVRLVVHRQHFEDLGSSAQPDALTMDLFNIMLERDNPKPSIHGIAGYSAQQIILDAIRSNTPREGRADRVYQVDHHMMVPGWPSTGEALKQFLKEIANTPKAWPILAFNQNVDDPDHRSLEDELGKAIAEFAEGGVTRDDLVICNLEHKADVPVGIGYSLPAFDWVAQNGNYEEVRRQAIAAANTDHTREVFKAEGVELDEPF